MADSGFVGVLVGGGLTAAVQWFVTPRIQRRIRADDRAERALDELAQFLDVEILEIANSLRSKIGVMRYLDELVSERSIPSDDPRIEEMRRADLAELTDAQRSLERAMRTRYRHLARQARIRWTGPALKLEVEAMRLPLASDLAAMTDADVGAWLAGFNAARRDILKEVDSKLEAFDRSRPTRMARLGRKVRHPVATWRSYRTRRA